MNKYPLSEETIRELTHFLLIKAVPRIIQAKESIEVVEDNMENNKPTVDVNALIEKIKLQIETEKERTAGTVRS